MIQPNVAVDAAQLDPALRYLRVTTNGTAALLVLGYVDTDAYGSPIEVWFSAQGEVLRLWRGRLAGVAGVPVEWRAVRWPRDLPEWRAVVAPHSFVRERDEMPGYRLGLVETVTLRPIQSPSNTQWRGSMPSDARWYEEDVDGSSSPAARYAVRVTPGGDLPI